MDYWFVILVGTRLVLFGLGLTTTVIAYRAYRRHGGTYLRDASIAFGFITVGVLIEGALYQFTALSLEQVHVVETITIGIGFAVLLYSFVS